MTRTGDSRYRRARAKLKREHDICHLCGKWIDPDLKTPHPMSFEADHIVPIARGGDNRGALAPSHRICNQRRGKKDIQPSNKHIRDF
ncbi:HNH endonuclease [Gordonia polyisoprenivorans]|uniref:HNH endonuclease n=1 Tax=Gordonia polyisoprenivorans TaxID=84595 RepID=UPI0019D80F88|nr:HNH endonuclease [Acetobacter sp.]UZF54346.1 HNH endonuclease [Gordonia polyisoprenivorans]